MPRNPRLKVSLLVIAVIIQFPFSSFGQQPIDLTGVWQGEFHIPGNSALIERYFQKNAAGRYSGVNILHWRKNGDNAPYLSGGPSIRTVKKVFVARLDGNTLYEAEVDTVESTPTSGGMLGSGKVQVVNDNGTMEIKPMGTDGGATVRLVSATFPDKYRQYLVDESTFRIDHIGMTTTDGSQGIKFNDRAQLTVALSNHAPVNFKNLTVRLTTSETENGLENYKDMKAEFALGRNANRNYGILLSTNFGVPADSLHFMLTISSGNVLIAQKPFALATDPFFKSAEVKVPSYTSSRLLATGAYYGFSNTPYTGVAKSLEPLVAAGDKMAGMWKAVFLSMGFGEYKIDEESGYAIGKPCISEVEEKARAGDAEAIYLMFYACQMGLEGESANAVSVSFLQKAATAGFKPAVYDYALQSVWRKDYAAAFDYLMKSYGMGVKKSAVLIGSMYERGLSVSNDIDSALYWYKAGEAFGDPDAQLALANVVAKGYGNTPPDIHKALELTTAAAAKNCTDAMIFNGTVYYDGKSGVQRNILTAIKWYKSAADQGDRQAMLALGGVYMAGGPGVEKDEHSGLFWIKKAAVLGSPKAMVVLSKCYNQGVGGENNVIAGRYWYNQAALNGYAQPDATGINAGVNNFMNFWKYADFTPSYIYVNEYGEKVADGDDGLMNGLFSGIGGAMMSYYGNHQQLIDGLEFIAKKGGVKIYGGTVSSHFISNLSLKQGQTVNIRSYGIVSTGMMSGPATADGLGNAWAEYRIVRDIPCSAVMAGVKESQWKFIGQHGVYTAPKDGPLLFALNAIDYANYKGYFDITVEVPDN